MMLWSITNLDQSISAEHSLGISIKTEPQHTCHPRLDLTFAVTVIVEAYEKPQCFAHNGRLEMGQTKPQLHTCSSALCPYSCPDSRDWLWTTAATNPSVQLHSLNYLILSFSPSKHHFQQETPLKISHSSHLPELVCRDIHHKFN